MGSISCIAGVSSARRTKSRTADGRRQGAETTARERRSEEGEEFDIEEGGRERNEDENVREDKGLVCFLVHAALQVRKLKVK